MKGHLQQQLGRFSDNKHQGYSLPTNWQEESQWKE